MKRRAPAGIIVMCVWYVVSAFSLYSSFMIAFAETGWYLMPAIGYVGLMISVFNLLFCFAMFCKSKKIYIALFAYQLIATVCVAAISENIIAAIPPLAINIVFTGYLFTSRGAVYYYGATKTIRDKLNEDTGTEQNPSNNDEPFGEEEADIEEYQKKNEDEENALNEDDKNK